MLGKGSFKTVFKGQDVQTGMQVAWNEIGIRNMTTKECDRVLNEMKLLKLLSHRCLITLFAAWVDDRALTVVFITDLMSSGTLRE